MNPELKQHLVSFVGALDEFTARFRKLASVSRSIKKQADYRIPIIVDKLVAKGIVSPSSSELVKEELKDPRKALILLEKVADKVRPNSFGVAVGSNKSASNYIIGQYVPEDERESGNIFKQAFMR